MQLKMVLVFALLCIIGLVVGAYGAPPNRGPARGASRPENIMAPIRVVTENQNTQDPVNPRDSMHMHPVSRLNLIQSMKRAKMPTYELIGLINMRNVGNMIVNRRFHMQVTLDDYVADAWGQTKKEAKREAAKALLTKMNLAVA